MNHQTRSHGYVLTTHPI